MLYDCRLNRVASSFSITPISIFDIISVKGTSNGICAVRRVTG